MCSGSVHSFFKLVLYLISYFFSHQIKEDPPWSFALRHVTHESVSSHGPLLSGLWVPGFLCLPTLNSGCVDTTLLVLSCFLTHSRWTMNEDKAEAKAVLSSEPVWLDLVVWTFYSFSKNRWKVFFLRKLTCVCIFENNSGAVQSASKVCPHYTIIPLTLVQKLNSSGGLVG